VAYGFPLQPMLHSKQTELGYVPSEAVPLLAAGLSLSTGDVHGAVTFYPDFRPSELSPSRQ